MEFSDGESLSESEELQVTVEFLRFKNHTILAEFKEFIPYNLLDSLGRNLLHWACEANQLTKAKFLVNEELVDLAARDLRGHNALELAARKGFTDLTTYLEELGLVCVIADPTQRLNPEVDYTVEGMLVSRIYADNCGELAGKCQEYLVNINGQLSIAEYFEWTLSLVAANLLAPKCLRWLIQHGANITEETSEGFVLDRVIESVLDVTPPENEEEYVQMNAGIDCLVVCLEVLQKPSLFKDRLRTLFARTQQVGRGSSTAEGSYEIGITQKVDQFRFKLAQLLRVI